MELAKKIGFHLGNIEDKAYAEGDYETVGKVKGFVNRLVDTMSQYNPDKELEYYAIEKMIYDKDFVKYSHQDVEFVYYYFTAWKERESSFDLLNEIIAKRVFDSETVANRVFDIADILPILEKIIFCSKEEIERFTKLNNNVAFLNSSLSLDRKLEIINQLIKDTGDEFWKDNFQMALIHKYFVSRKYLFLEVTLREKYKESDKLIKEKYPF